LEEILKKCSKCKEYKSKDEFGKNKTRKDGLEHRCKKCRKRSKKIQEEINLEVKNSKNELKRCGHCKKWKIKTEFNKSKRRKDGLDNWCKNCIKNKQELNKSNKKIYDTKYILQNKEKIKNKKMVRLNKTVSFYSFFTEYLIKYNYEVKNNNGFLEIKCKWCNKWFLPIYKYIQYRINAINGLYSFGVECHLYCSDDCKNKCPIFNLRTDPNEIIEKELRISIPQWLRKEILDRDNNECIICNSKENLELHHEKPLKENAFFQLDKDYIHTVCKNCHLNIIHKPDGLCSLNELRSKNCKKIGGI
jgi:hypothetical protein